MRPAQTSRPTTPRSPSHSATRTTGTAEVDAFVAALEHPRKAALLSLRSAILRVDPRIREAVKWNAPSFLVDDHFATFKLRPPTTLQRVPHAGAKAQRPPKAFRLDDPRGLVRWAAPNRCVATFATVAAAREHEAVLCDLVRQWTAQL
jgi:hypothetical protein